MTEGILSRPLIYKSTARRISTAIFKIQFKTILSRMVACNLAVLVLLVKGRRPL